MLFAPTRKPINKHFKSKIKMARNKDFLVKKIKMTNQSILWYVYKKFLTRDDLHVEI
jgi:hypothetical protein